MCDLKINFDTVDFTVKNFLTKYAEVQAAILAEKVESTIRTIKLTHKFVEIIAHPDHYEIIGVDRDRDNLVVRIDYTEK